MRGMSIIHVSCCPTTDCCIGFRVRPFGHTLNSDGHLQNQLQNFYYVSNSGNLRTHKISTKFKLWWTLMKNNSMFYKQKHKANYVRVPLKPRQSAGALLRFALCLVPFSIGSDKWNKKYFSLGLQGRMKMDSHAWYSFPSLCQHRNILPANRGKE